MIQISSASVASVQVMEHLLQKFDAACTRALEKGDTAGCDRMAARHIKTILERLLQESDSLDDVNLRKFMDALWETGSRLGLVERFYTRQDSCTAFLPIMLHRALSVVDRAGDDSGLAWVIQGILDVYWQCEFTSADTLGADGVPFEEKPQPERHERAWQFRERLRTLKLQYLRKLRQGGQKIRVTFLVHRPAVWQYEGVYRLMEAGSVFEPVVAVAPFVSALAEEREHNRELCLERFGKGYNAIFFFGRFNHAEFREQCKADIVFFTDSWGSVCSSYCIVSSMDCLTCYAPYGFYSANMQGSQYNKIFHHFLDYFFCETPIHLQMAKRYADNRGLNVYHAGYTKLDSLLMGQTTMADPWGKGSSCKRIIWAPHFTVGENESVQGYSCFLHLAEFMLTLAQQFSDHLQIAFKPHPNLKATLYRVAGWGVEKTEQYWQAWENLPGSRIVETDYISLFFYSDGMILDSVSFISEYMVTGKPMLFTVRDESVMKKWNEYGLPSFHLCYFAKEYEREISAFIKDVIFEKKDFLQKKRYAFIEKNLVPPNGISSSSNVVNILLKNI